MSIVTVLLPTHNGMPYLKAAVESILRQTFDDLTLLVIDDGSTDGTADHLQTVRDCRMRVERIAHSGLGGALNFGIGVSSSEYIARMDADDISLPTRLEKQIRFLEAHSEVGLVGTRFAYCASKASFGFSPSLYQDHESIVAALLRMSHAVCHATIVCRTEVLRRIGGYRVTGAGQDWDMFLRMSESCRLANLAEVLYLYRLHTQSINAVSAARVRLQRAYACDCAKRRAKGVAEQSIEEFQVSSGQMSVLTRASRALDIASLELYRRGIADVLSQQRLTGYGRLVLSAGLSPNRVVQRVLRAIRAKAFELQAPTEVPPSATNEMEE